MPCHCRHVALCEGVQKVTALALPRGSLEPACEQLGETRQDFFNSSADSGRTYAQHVFHLLVAQNERAPGPQKC